MALVDEMAKAARSELELGEAVFAEDTNGLRHRKQRAAEVGASAAGAPRAESARIAPEGAGMMDTPEDFDGAWLGRGRRGRPELLLRNNGTGAFRRAQATPVDPAMGGEGVPLRRARESQPYR